MAEKLISIFRTKQDILTARDFRRVEITKDVLKNPEFTEAKQTDTLGFIIKGGSDFTVIDVKAVQNDPKAFLEIAFGERGDNIVEASNP